MIQVLTVRAFNIVSAVVNVFDTTTTEPAHATDAGYQPAHSSHLLRSGDNETAKELEAIQDRRASVTETQSDTHV